MLIHPDQTGFIPQCSIFDPITMCNYTDHMEQDGTIVALDQEKAYNKINHTYLLMTLYTFKLPECFISTISSLYEHAHTSLP